MCRLHGDQSDVELPKILPRLLIVNEVNLIDIMFISIATEAIPAVEYCSKRTIFPLTWIVSLTPFNYTVWFVLSASIVAVALILTKGELKMKKVWLQIYVIFAYLLRQPVKELPPVVGLIALLWTIIPTAYETLITGNAIAPSKLEKYYNVRDFLNSYSKIVHYSASHFPIEGIMKFEFKKYDIESKYNSKFQIIYVKNFTDEEIENEMISKPVGIFGYYQQSNIQIYRWLNRRNNDKCDIFLSDQRLTYYSHTYAPFYAEAYKIYTALQTSGIKLLWNAWFYEALYNSKIRNVTNTTESQLIFLENLDKFIAVCGIILAISLLIFLMELGRGGICVVTRYRRVGDNGRCRVRIEVALREM